MDLVKAYDHVDWNFLRMVLFHIGLTCEVVHWIMGYVTTTTFYVLVNGSPSSFSKLQGDSGKVVHYLPYYFYWLLKALVEL